MAGDNDCEFCSYEPCVAVAQKLLHDEEQPFVIDEGEPEDRDGTVALCRCGLSADKPYRHGLRARRGRCPTRDHALAACDSLDGDT